MESVPPRLAPTGVLSQGQGVIKPIACRPMVSSSAHTTPILGNRIAPNNEPSPTNSVARTGLYSSTSDLSRAAPPPANKLRFSWSKPEAGRPPAQQGRVADLSRRFGGSLSSVAPPNSPAATAAAVLPPVAGQPRQPPAYRPPPSSRCPSKGSNYSSSELHLDRALRPSAAPSAPQWALGGSEINLSSLMSRSTLPLRQETDSSGTSRPLLSTYDPNGMRNGTTTTMNGSRSSWAGLPTYNHNNNNNHHSVSNLNHHHHHHHIGSTTTLTSSREDDVATPIVDQGGRIRSSILSRFRKHSVGSLEEDLDSIDGPSPPSSELEGLLKEKDCEIALLRETLEQNEAVIFQVYQEKEKSWERELKKLRSIYEERMRASQQMASQAERQLQNQTAQWQAERKQLKQTIQQLQMQCDQVQGRLDETSWTLCQKSGEMALVKSQLKEAQSDTSQRNQELAKLRVQLKETEMTNNRRSITSPVPSRKLAFLADDTSSLRAEVQRLQRRLADQQQSIDAERQVWHEEKATVLVYQRHLQQQYVQAMKRNQQLEEALGLLGITGVGNNKDSSQMSSPKSNCSDPIQIDLDSSSNSSGSSETHC